MTNTSSSSNRLLGVHRGNIYQYVRPAISGRAAIIFERLWPRFLHHNSRGTIPGNCSWEHWEKSPEQCQTFLGTWIHWCGPKLNSPELPGTPSITSLMWSKMIVAQCSREHSQEQHAQVSGNQGRLPTSDMTGQRSPGFEDTVSAISGNFRKLPEITPHCISGQNWRKFTEIAGQNCRKLPEKLPEVSAIAKTVSFNPRLGQRHFWGPTWNNKILFRCSGFLALSLWRFFLLPRSGCANFNPNQATSTILMNIIQQSCKCSTLISMCALATTSCL